MSAHALRTVRMLVSANMYLLAQIWGDWGGGLMNLAAVDLCIEILSPECGCGVGEGVKFLHTPSPPPSPTPPHRPNNTLLSTKISQELIDY